MSSALDPGLIGEAADWLIRLDQGSLHADEQQALERWRTLSPAHEVAWRRAEGVMRTIEAVPSGARGPALRTLASGERRRTLSRLALLLVAAPGAWMLYRNLPWQDWTADLRTATGEQKRMLLPDGTSLVLNTASAVDLAFSASERRLRLLLGEIMVTTGQDPSPQYRPFIVETAQGSMRALGTRFGVRLGMATTQLEVFEHAVEISPAQSASRPRIEAGQAAQFNALGLSGGVSPQDPAAGLWERGLLLAQKMPLATLLAELGRYRKGLLRCHPQIARLSVSGAFSVTDTDASLRLLQKTLPVHISTLTRYWVTVDPA